MAAKTNIEWTDATWNPVRGCSRVSPGCVNCYAEKVAYRFSGPGQPYEGLVRINSKGERKPEWNGQVQLVEKHLLDPLKWKEPRRIFVNSMSDLFHENIPDEWIDKVFAVMALAPQHKFQVLTKRPERMLRYFSRLEEDAGEDHHWWDAALDSEQFTEYQLQAIGDVADPVLPNVWLGVSAEDQKTADERIPLLLQTPSAVRFISAEPLLGAIDLTCGFRVREGVKQDALYGSEGLRWVIVGGESGPGARPMHPDWVRSLRDQCVTAKVPFFFKQWGEWAPGECVPMDGEYKVRSYFDGKWSEDTDDWIAEQDNGPLMYRVGKHDAGAALDGCVWRQFPEWRA